MAIDGISADILALELNERLEGAKVDRIQQPDRTFVTMQFYRQGQSLRLAISVNPSNPTIYPMSDTPPNPQIPLGFCSFLRKHLLGANVVSVSCPDYERLVEFHFVTSTEIGDADERYMIIELMGRHSNIIVLNKQRVILDSMTHVDETMSSLRQVMPARPYHYPPKQDKAKPETTLARLKAFEGWEHFWEEEEGRTMKQVLQAQLLGFSPQVILHILKEAQIDPQLLWSSFLTQVERGLALKYVLETFLTEVTQKRTSPVLIYRNEAELLPEACHAYNLKGLGTTRAQTSYLEALRSFESRKQAIDRFKQQQQTLQGPVEARLQRSLRRAENLRVDLAETVNADLYQKYGELILANLYQLKGKASEITVTDYYDPDQQTIAIPMDPRYDANHNAQRYFRQAGRLRTAAEVLLPQIQEEEANSDYLLNLLNLIQTSESDRELEDLSTEIALSPLFRPRERHASSEASSAPLMPAGKPAKSRRSAKEQRFLQKQQQQAKSRKAKKGLKSPAALPPRRYRSSDGFVILCGRSNVQNDQLTMRTAQKHDLWFHVQKDAGTHVIVRTEGQPVPDRTIEEAASIAAWFSRGNRSQQEALQVQVPVDFCPVAQVRKPNGAKPGFVVYERHQTIWVQAINPEGLLDQ